MHRYLMANDARWSSRPLHILYTCVYGAYVYKYMLNYIQIYHLYRHRKHRSSILVEGWVIRQTSETSKKKIMLCVHIYKWLIWERPSAAVETLFSYCVLDVKLFNFFFFVNSFHSIIQIYIFLKYCAWWERTLFLYLLLLWCIMSSLYTMRVINIWPDRNNNNARAVCCTCYTYATSDLRICRMCTMMMKVYTPSDVLYKHILYTMQMIIQYSWVMRQQGCISLRIKIILFLYNN